MTELSSVLLSERPSLTFVERIATWCAWAMGAGLFLTVGWLAVEPDDPLAAVSLLTRDGVVSMLLQMASLGAVTAAVATVIAGRRLVDVGTFATALGLSLVSLRGDTAEYLLISSADRSPDFSRTLSLQLAAESLGWLGVIVIALSVSAVVTRWCFGSSDSWEPAADIRPPESTGASAAEDDSASRDRASVAGGEWAGGVKHLLMVAGIGLLAFLGLSASLATRSIRHGQACFVVAAAVSVGVYVAHRLAPVRSATWSIFAIGLMAVLGFVWASFQPVATGLPANIPSSAFLRVLPIQHISVGVATAVAMFWYMQHPTPIGGDKLVARLVAESVIESN